MSAPQLVESEDWNALIERLEMIVPSNIILHWYGVEADVPSGWTICDGRARPAGSSPANTPDLSASFIKGAAVDGDVGVTGGSTSHQHAAPVGYLASDDPITLRGSDAPYGTTGIANRAMSRKGYDWQQYSNTVKLTSSTGHEPTYYRLYQIMKD